MTVYVEAFEAKKDEGKFILKVGECKTNSHAASFSQLSQTHSEALGAVKVNVLERRSKTKAH